MNDQDTNGSGANGGPLASGTSSGRSGNSMNHGGASMSSRAAGGASADNIREAQETLQDQGLYHGQVDGKWGPQTKRAVSQFQKQKGLKQTAQLDEPTLNDLQSGSTSGSGSPNGSPSRNSGGGASSGMGGNGPSSTQTNPGGQSPSSMPTH